MELFLYLHGSEISADVDAQEAVILGVASGQYSRAELVDWLSQHIQQVNSSS